MVDGKLWTQHDRFGNEIYLTRERWAHIIDLDNHPEVAHSLIMCGKPSDMSFARMMQTHRDQPLQMPLANLRNLPDHLWEVVLAVVTTPPVSDFLSVGLSLSPEMPPLPQPVAA